MLELVLGVGCWVLDNNIHSRIQHSTFKIEPLTPNAEY